MNQNETERGFTSWVQALRDKLLNEDQLAVLQEMVDQGEVDTLERAAQLLDWHEMMVDRPQHMYGF
ncbi:MAG: hypothetical protein U0175_34525 [Caldilineaceae bacterium]